MKLHKRNWKTTGGNYLIAATLILACTLAAAGQVNTEQYRSLAEKEGFGGILDLSLSWYKGNTDLLAGDVEMQLHYNKGKYQSFLRGILKYGEKGDEEYINMGFLHLRGIRKFNDRFMGEIFIQEEFNKFILLEERTLAGGGLRYRVCCTEKKGPQKKNSLHLYLGSGLMWERETFSQAEDGSKKEESSRLKSTSYISLDCGFGGRTGLNLVSYFQFNLDELATLRILADLGFEFKLSSRLSYKTKLSYRFDNRPPATVKKYDIQVSNGLSFSF